MMTTTSWILIGILSFLALLILGFIGYVIFSKSAPTPSPSPNGGCKNCPAACDPATGECVNCMKDSDCQGGQKCETSSDSSQNKCVGCITSTDCCDKSNPPKCLSCIDGACECQTNSQCQNIDPSQVCTNGKCQLQPCNTQADCNALDMVCSNGFCVKSPCGGPCPGTQKCNSVTKQCVDCLTNTDCGDGMVCYDGSCVSSSSCNVVGCPTPLICNHTTGKCYECTSNSNCTGGKICDHTSDMCINCDPSINDKCDNCNNGNPLHDPLCNTYNCCTLGSKCSNASKDPNNVRCCPEDTYGVTCSTGAACKDLYSDNPYCVNGHCTCAAGSIGDGCLADNDCTSGLKCLGSPSVCTVPPRQDQGLGTNERLRTNKKVKLDSTISDQILKGQTSYFPMSRYDKPKHLRNLSKARLYDYM